MQNLLKVALAQISPVWLNKVETLNKVKQSIIEASKESCELIVFGEGLVPGYPFWLSLTGGAEWNKAINKELHAHYVRNAITIENGDAIRSAVINKIENGKYAYGIFKEKTALMIASTFSFSLYVGMITRRLDIINICTKITIRPQKKPSRAD